MEIALHFLRLITAGEVASAWAKFWVLRGSPRIRELTVAGHGATAFRYEKAQNADWTHLARRRLEQCVRYQKSEFFDRARGQAATPSRPFLLYLPQLRAADQRYGRQPERGATALISLAETDK